MKPILIIFVRRRGGFHASVSRSCSERKACTTTDNNLFHEIQSSWNDIEN
jgi:hypothetical protein